MSQPAGESSTKPRPKLFRALGANDLPGDIEIAGRSYALAESFKHDSWAATGLYAGPHGKVICKFNRTQSVFGLSMRWLGRRLARREARLLQRLADLPNLPRGCDAVSVSGVVQPNAVARVYIPGHPLRRGEQVNDEFFPQLRKTFDVIHSRAIAYVDLHKRENIIVGDDGRPYLIDFQICWSAPENFWGRTWPLTALTRTFQRGDNYHLFKHIVRHRPDQLPENQRDIDAYRPWFLRIYRNCIGNPFRFLRRRVLVFSSVRSGRGRSNSEVAPEDAVRQEMERTQNK